MDLSKIQMLIDAAALVSGSPFPNHSEIDHSYSTASVQAVPSVGCYEEVLTSSARHCEQNTSFATFPEADASFRNIQTSTPKQGATDNILLAEPDASQRVRARSQLDLIVTGAQHGSYLETGRQSVDTEAGRLSGRQMVTELSHSHVSFTEAQRRRIETDAERQKMIELLGFINPAPQNRMSPDPTHTETNRQMEIAEMSRYFGADSIYRLVSELHRQRVANETLRNFIVSDLWNRTITASDRQQEHREMSCSITDIHPIRMSSTPIDSDLREKSFVGTTRKTTEMVVDDSSTDVTESEGQKFTKKSRDSNTSACNRSPDTQREGTLHQSLNNPTKLPTENCSHITDTATTESSRGQSEPIQKSNLDASTAVSTADDVQSRNSDASDSDYVDVDDDAKEIRIGDLTLFNEFIIEEYFEKYENQTLMIDDEDFSFEGNENRANSGNEHQASLKPGESACNMDKNINFFTELPSKQPLRHVQLQSGDLGFQELNTENPTSKKQKINPRKASQIARMKGIQYTRADGVVIPARSVKLPCSCSKYKCYTKYSDAMRHKLLENLLKLTVSGQNQFLSNHMSIRTTARPKALFKSRRVFTRAYYLPAVNGRVHVCKEMFMSTFDVKDKKIRTLADKKIVGAGVSADDYRTKNRSKKALDESDIDYVQQHIRSFPAYTSHYARERSEKLYLSSDLSVRRLYDLFKAKCLEDNKQAVHYSTYRIIFKRMNISFRKLKVDTCCKCDKFAISIKLATRAEEITEIEQLKNIHHDEAQEAYRQKKYDVQTAKIDGRCRTASFDLQKCLPTPHLSTGIAFYRRQLYTYNLTVFATDNKANTVKCYLWDESKARRGSQEIGSCLLKDLESIDRHVEVIIYYSDRCAGQNHNIVICMMFSYFIEKCISMGRKVSIEHKFMCSGHSHMEVDSAHGAIEKAKKRCSMNIETPRDWAVFIAAINRKIPFTVIEMEQCEFLALKNLEAFYKRAKKNVDDDTLRFHDISAFKYTTDNPGIVYYKYKLGDSDFSSFSMNRDLKDPVDLPSPLTDEPIPIAEKKLEDLRKLMDFVSNKAYYQTLLRQIIPKKRGRRSKTEKTDNFKGDLDFEENFAGS